MKILYEIKEKMEEELKDLCKKDTLTNADIELIYKMIDVVKDISTVEAMKNAEEQGWSRDYSYDDYSYARGRNAIGRYTSRDGGSYARGGSYMGSYDDGYSRHGKEETISNIKSMMMQARTPEERESYRATIEQMSR